MSVPAAPNRTDKLESSDSGVLDLTVTGSARDLMEAAAVGDVAEVTRLLEFGVDVNSKNAMGYVALRESVVNNHIDVCRLLLDRGARVDVRDDMGWTALHWAAHKGHAGIVNLLLERGAVVNASNTDGDTPAHKAGGKGHVTVLRMLVDNGADLSIRNRDERNVLEQTEHRMSALVPVKDDNNSAEDYRKRQESLQFIRSVSVRPLSETGNLDVEPQSLVKVLIADNKQLRQDLEELRGNMSRVDGEKSCLEKVIRTQNADRLVLEEHIEELVQIKETKEAELDELAHAHHDTVETLREEIERGQEQIRTLQRDLERGNHIQQQQEGQISGLREEVFRLRNEKDRLDSELSSLHDEQVKVLEQRTNEQTFHQEAVGRLKGELRDVRRMAEQQQMLLAARLADTECAKVARNRKDEKLKTAAAEHEVELVMMEEQVEALRSRLAEKENKIQEIHLLELQKASLAERYGNENAQLRNDIQALKQELKHIQEAHGGEVEEMRIQSQQRQDELERNLQQIQEEATSLADRLAVMARDKANFEAAMSECEQMVEICTGVLKVPETELQVSGKVIGRGSFAEVRVGCWQGTSVAVKAFHDAIMTNYNQPLFLQEISMCSRVRHPHVVAICGVTAMKDAAPRIILELLEGSLADVLSTAHSSDQYLTFREQTDIAIDCLLGISHLHSIQPNALLHGDIRPTNILLTGLMTAKIGDLGAAHFLGVSLSVGPVSWDYLAPERFPTYSGSHPHNTPGADIYSLGVTLAEVFTGSLSDCHSRHRHIRKIDYDNIRDLCLRMIGDDPSKRPSAREVLQGLHELRNHEHYKPCPPKRLVKGKRYGDRVVLTSQPW